MASIHEKLGRVRKPRVHIKYEVETGDAVVQKELPFVAGVMGDFSGDPSGKLKPLRDRNFIQIDRDNFDKVMERIAPRLVYQVSNTLEEGGQKNLGVELNFNKMDDFEPGRVVDQIPALKALKESRDKLRDLLSKADRSQDLEELLEKVLQNNQDIGELSKALGLDNESGAQPADAKKEE